MKNVDVQQLYEWCKIPADELERQQNIRIPFRIVKDSKDMGEEMAREFVDEIKMANRERRTYRAIVPCGPKCWYEPFVRIVNEEQVSLKYLIVFHMDECLDWEGRLLAQNDPYNFKTFMEKYFYGGVLPELSVPEEQRIFLEPTRIEEISRKIAEAPIDLTIGGWGQDGHLAYNQARRHPYSSITLQQLRNSQIRIQENNWDTIMTLAHRSFGAAYQFVPAHSSQKPDSLDHE